MTSPARFREHFPGYPESSKIALSLQRDLRAAGRILPPTPRCSRFQPTKSFPRAAESTTTIAGEATTTTTVATEATTTTAVSDTFANHRRSTRSTRFSRPSSVSSRADTTTFTHNSAPTVPSRAPVSSAAETTKFTTTTSTYRNRASRFQPTKAFPYVNETTTFTNTMTSRAGLRDPVSRPTSSRVASIQVIDVYSQMPSTTLPPLRAQQPARKPSTKPSRVIQCRPLPDGKFPTNEYGLDYDTSKEVSTMTLRNV
jgi:hypothetical protein